MREINSVHIILKIMKRPFGNDHSLEIASLRPKQMRVAPRLSAVCRRLGRSKNVRHFPACHAALAGGTAPGMLLDRAIEGASETPRDSPHPVTHDHFLQ